MTVYFFFLLSCSGDSPPSSPNETDSKTQTEDPMGTDTAMVLEECILEDVGTQTPFEIQDTTLYSSDLFMSSCSSGEGSGDSDRAYRWTSPKDGFFKFSTEGSSFDTVLTLYEDGDCSAEQITCNDDMAEGIYQSEIRRLVAQGETFLVVVDSYEEGERGDFSLSISTAEQYCEDGLDNDEDGLSDCEDDDCLSIAPNCQGIECPSETITSVPFSFEGTTSGDSVIGYATCGDGGGRAPDATFSFLAPYGGLFRFHTIGSSFDTLLSVRSDYCTGEEIACDDDMGGELTSWVELQLEEGQTVVLIVDGWGGDEGDFSLSVEGVEQDCEDGIDNDNDLLIDCDDSDCLSIECVTGGSWPDDWTILEEDMLTEVNLRRSEGAYCDQDYYPPVPPLESNNYLQLSARLHSHDMSVQDYFEHTGLDGRSPHERIRDAGFQGAAPTGENISGGYSTAAESVEGLMNSPGHCRNIMDPEYTVVGMGYAYTPDSHFGHYWTQNFGGSH